MKNREQYIKYAATCLYAAILCVVAYLGIVSRIWQINNPKANSMTFYTHFQEAIRFQTLDEFQ